MKRHEYLRSAILSFITAALIIIAGIVLHLAVIKPFVEREPDAFVLNLIPSAIYAIGLMFVIIGSYALYNEYSLEHGEDIVAKITGIKEYFYGKSNTDIHYNLFCQWKCPSNGRTYRYMVKNLPTNPQNRFPDNKITVRISRKDPRLHYIEL